MASSASRTGWLAASALVATLAVLTLLWLGSGPAGEPATGAGVPVTADEVPAPAGPAPAGGDVMPLVEAEAPAPAPEPPAVERPAALHELLASRRDDDEPSGTLRLAVVDTASRPVADARVALWARAELASRPGGEPLAVRSTDGRGRCELERPPRGAVVLASKPGLGTSGLWSRGALAERAGPDGETVLVLEPQATLRGRVLHADDAPAPGAALHFASLARGGACAGRAPGGRLVTDGDGRFEVPLDAGARLAVTAVDGDLVSHETRVDARPGAELEVLVRFPGRWSVEGVLLDPAGEPAPGEVTLWRHFPGVDVLGGERPAGEPHRAGTAAGDDGRFRLDVPRPGEYVLVGRADDLPPSRPAVAFVDDALPRAEVRLELPPAAAIAGRLVAANGLPLAGVTVRARPAHLYEPAAFAWAPTVWGLHGEAEDETGEDGRFVLEPLHPEGTYIVFCRPDETRREHKLVVQDVRPGGRELALVATEDSLRRGWVAGTVLADATGLPVTDFVPVLVIELDGRLVDTEQPRVRSEDGAFRVEGLAPGYRYALRIDAPGHGSVELPWFTASHRGHRVTARLPAVGSLEVTVVDAAGRPVELAEVSARREAALAAGPRGRRGGHTGGLGRLRLQDLPPGTWRIHARHGEREGSAAVLVGPAAAAAATVTLDG